MDTQGNGLTLEALAESLEALQREHAEKLQALERENERMRSENVELRSKVATLEHSGTRVEKRLARERGPHTRRRSGEGAEAAAAFDVSQNIEAHIVDAQYLVATAYDPYFRDAIYASISSDSYYGVYGINRGSEAGVHGYSKAGSGVSGKSDGVHEAGVKGEGYTGVYGLTYHPSNAGVYGEHTGTTGYGVVGDAKGESEAGIPGGAGVLGRNPGGTGVKGESPQVGYGAITGEHTGSSGYGVIGLGTGPSAGVLGRNSSGYGGQFEGGKAQLKLKPGESAGAPSGTHDKGEIYMDSNGTLFVCVAEGVPGTWREVATTTEEATV